MGDDVVTMQTVQDKVRERIQASFMEFSTSGHV